jgi:hypothetical protein
MAARVADFAGQPPFFSLSLYKLPLALANGKRYVERPALAEQIGLKPGYYGASKPSAKADGNLNGCFDYRIRSIRNLCRLKIHKEVMFMQSRGLYLL